MFPEVNRKSFTALLRFSQSKPRKNTQTFLETVWDREAIHRMMFLSASLTIEDLVNWLTTPGGVEYKTNVIINSINQFK